MTGKRVFKSHLKAVTSQRGAVSSSSETSNGKKSVIRPVKNVLVAVSTTSGMGVCAPSWTPFDNLEAGEYFSAAKDSLMACEMDSSDEENAPIPTASRLSFATLFVGDLFTKVAGSSSKKKAVNYTFVTFSDRVETKLAGLLPGCTAELSTKLHLLPNARGVLNASFRLETLINLISNAASEGILYDEAIIILDSDLRYPPDSPFHTLAELLPCHFLVLSTPEFDRGPSPILSKLRNVITKNNTSSLTVWSHPTEREELVKKFSALVLKLSDEVEKAVVQPGIPLRIGNIRGARVKTYIVRSSKEKNCRLLVSCSNVIEIVGFLEAANVDKDLIGCGFARRYWIENAYGTSTSDSKADGDVNANEVGKKEGSDDNRARLASKSAAVLKMLSTSLVETSTVALCRLLSQGKPVKYAVLFPMRVGVMATSNKKAALPISLLLGCLSNNSETWKHLLSYTAQMDPKSAPSRVVPSCMTPTTDWTNAAAMGKVTLKLQKIVTLKCKMTTKSMNLNSELERMVDYGAVTGTSLKWLSEFLLSLLPLADNEQLANALRNWAQEISSNSN